MDPFLAGMYDDDLVSEPVDLETQIQHHIVKTSQAEMLFNDQVGVENVAEQEQFITLELNEQERQHFLERISVIEKGMQEAGKDLQQRIDTMKRILEFKDPMKQLAEYLRLKQEDRQDDNVDIVEDLLQCANRMTNIEDSEVAALGAFFFMCDRQRPKARVMIAMLPVVAAMLKASSEMDHTRID